MTRTGIDGWRAQHNIVRVKRSLCTLENRKGVNDNRLSHMEFMILHLGAEGGIPARFDGEVWFGYWTIYCWNMDRFIFMVANLCLRDRLVYFLFMYLSWTCDCVLYVWKILPRPQHLSRIIEEGLFAVWAKQSIFVSKQRRMYSKKKHHRAIARRYTFSFAGIRSSKRDKPAASTLN